MGLFTRSYLNSLLHEKVENVNFEQFFDKITQANTILSHKTEIFHLN